MKFISWKRINVSRIAKILGVIVAVFLIFSFNVHGAIGAMAYIAARLGMDFASASVEIGTEIVRKAFYTIFIKFFFFSSIKNALKPDVFFKLLLLNPNIIEESGEAEPLIVNKINLVIQDLLIPFYILAFIIIGIYLLVLSGSPTGRAKAKRSLLKLIISIFVLIIVVPILQFLLDLSTDFTEKIINLGDKSYAKFGLEVLKEGVEGLETTFTFVTPITYWLGIFFFLLSAVVFLLPFMVLCMRYFMVILFFFLFPIGVFAMALHPIQRIGREIIRQTILWTFIPPLMALVLVIIGVASPPLLHLVPDSTMKTALGLAAFFALGTTPLTMVGVLNWLEMLAISFAAVEAPLFEIVGMIQEELKIKEE